MFAGFSLLCNSMYGCLFISMVGGSRLSPKLYAKKEKLKQNS
jgi:hypothetical protein